MQSFVKQYGNSFKIFWTETKGVLLQYIETYSALTSCHASTDDALGFSPATRIFDEISSQCTRSSILYSAQTVIFKFSILVFPEQQFALSRKSLKMSRLTSGEKTIVKQQGLKVRVHPTIFFSYVYVYFLDTNSGCSDNNAPMSLYNYSIFTVHSRVHFFRKQWFVLLTILFAIANECGFELQTVQSRYQRSHCVDLMSTWASILMQKLENKKTAQEKRGFIRKRLEKSECQLLHFLKTIIIHCIITSPARSWQPLGKKRTFVQYYCSISSKASTFYFPLSKTV